MKSVLIIFLILNINFSKIFNNFNISNVLAMPINIDDNINNNNINYSIYAPYHLKNQNQTKTLLTSNYQFSLYQVQLKKKL